MGNINIELDKRPEEVLSERNISGIGAVTSFILDQFNLIGKTAGPNTESKETTPSAKEDV